MIVMIGDHKQSIRVSSHSPWLEVLITGVFAGWSELQHHGTNVGAIYTCRNLRFQAALEL